MLTIEEKVEKAMKKGEYINWEDICHNYALTEEFIRRYKDFVSWGYVSWSQGPLSEEFIREFADKLEWIHLCVKQSMSEKFIEEMTYYIYWNALCAHQKLSEEFIEKYKEYINWNSIFERQKVSDEFIWKYRNKIGYLIYCKLKNKFDNIFEKFGDPNYAKRKFSRHHKDI